MNEFDSERIEFILQRNGYNKVECPEKADLIIFNTCSVRKKAEDRLYGNIGNLKSLKAENPQLIICVGGCTAQSLGEKILQDFSHVDIVFGTQNIDRLPELINRRYIEEGNICNIAEYNDDASDENIYNFKRIHRFKAFLPISIGCNNFCSYCIVPYVRGRERSIKPDKIISTIDKLVDDGVVEIVLLGQNVNSYGKDFELQYKKYDFPWLLKHISANKNLKRIRFMTSHPKDFSKSVVDVIKDNKNIMNHIHLPVQAGSDRILELMNRKYKRDDFIDVYNYIKREIPDCAVTTDIIVGFPGETADDFGQTLEIVKKLRFNRAFTFVYSPRRGTEAENYNDDVSSFEKQKRLSELINLQNMISLEENEKFIDKDFEVLVEGRSVKNDNQYEGRLENNIIINFGSKADVTGKFLNVRVTGARTFYLTGEIADNVY